MAEMAGAEAPPGRVRVAILLSGRGTNMAAIAEHRRKAEVAYEIALIASNVPEARGLVLARRYGFPSWAHSHAGIKRAAFDEMLDAELRTHDVELIALAGYMRLLSPQFIDKWRGRILNIHPSLLPLHKGLDSHRRALLAGDVEHGCSVHVVTEDLDDGPVIAQARLRIWPRDTPESLAKRVLEEEHKLYPVALDVYCRQLRGLPVQNS